MAVALVTGAGSGIGRAIATALVNDGHAVALATRQRDGRGVELRDELAERGRVLLIHGDLSDAGVPARLVAETTAGLGPISALVNNAGVSLAGPFLDLTVSDFDTVFAVDVRAAFLLAQAAASTMRDRGGAIVNVTSVHEHVPREGFVVYAAAKAALGMLTKGMALELARFDIRVNSVAPGVIATERNAEADSLAGEVPLGRAGDAAEVAVLVAHLLRPESRYVTGASFVIDGGLSQSVVAPRAEVATTADGGRVEPLC